MLQEVLLERKGEVVKLEDTLKTVSVGVSGSLASWLEIAPPFFSAMAAIATLVYMAIKIYKEL